MAIHKVKINGTVYENVGSIEKEPQTEYYHKVTTLDGKTHQDTRYTKTNYRVVFFNLLDGDYTDLINKIKLWKDTPKVCGFPDDDNGFIEAEYRLSIVKPSIMKGYLRGKYYRNGMEVLFEAVNADE